MNIKLVIILIFIGLLLLACTDREIYNGTGPDPSIGGDYTRINGIIKGTLLKSDSPFYVSATISVEGNDTLIIEPGVELFFNSSSQLKVTGTLVAIGDQQNRISFKPFEINIGWLGVHLLNTSTSSILRFCDISDVYLSTDSSVKNGAVEFTNAQGEISNCYFEYNYAVFGGAIYCENSSIEIKNNIFYQNDAEIFGGAIYSFSSSNKIYNNSAYRNSCYNYGGGFVFENALNEDVQNNILYRNFSFTGDSRIAIFNSDSTNINLQYNFLGSEQMNPLFIDEQNLHLQISSPCIDNGNPDPAFNDVDGSRNDQGAYGGPNGDW